MFRSITSGSISHVGESEFIHSSIRNGSEFNCKQNYKLKFHFFRSNEIEEEHTTMALIAPMILKKICPILMTSMNNKPMSIASSESGSNDGDAFENELWKDENENFGLRDPSVERRRLWENIQYHIGGTTDLYFLRLLYSDLRKSMKKFVGNVGMPRNIPDQTEISGGCEACKESGKIQ